MKECPRRTKGVLKVGQKSTQGKNEGMLKKKQGSEKLNLTKLNFSRIQRLKIGFNKIEV